MNTGEPNLEGAEALLGECDWLRRLARSLVSDSARAEDAVQETLAAAIQSAPAGEAPTRSWLSRVLRNALAQENRGRVRREDREALVEPRTAAPASDKIAERMELQRLVFDSVSSLEPIYRDVIVLRYFDGLPPREIAKQLDRPVKTVHTRIQRALELLRGKLDGDFEGGRDAWLAALFPFATGAPTIPVSPNPVSVALSPGVQFALGAALVVVGLVAFPYGEPEENNQRVDALPRDEVETPEEPVHVPAELEEAVPLEVPQANEPRVPLVSASEGESYGPASVVMGTVTDGLERGVSVELWAMRLTPEERGSDRTHALLNASLEPRVEKRTSSDRDGRFELGGLATGSWWIGLAPNERFMSIAVRADLGSDATDLFLDAESGERILGRVTSGDSERVGELLGEGEECVVLIGPIDWEIGFGLPSGVELLCGYDGSFESDPLPSGTYGALVGIRGEGSSGLLQARGTSKVRTGEPNLLAMSSPAPRISGVVRDGATGEPTKAKVTAVWKSGSRSQGTLSDPPGVFEFDGLDRTIYTIRASKPDGQVAILGNVDFQDGKPISDLELYLEPGAHFDLTLEGPRDRCRVAMYWDGILVDDFTLKKPDGNAVSLPAGPILIEAYVHENGQRISLGETSLTAIAGSQSSLVVTVDR